MKRDGENTALNRDFIHARSLDSSNHPSRNWIKNLWGSIRYSIPEGITIHAENLYARHSIKYDNLDSYCEVFGAFKGDKYLSWYDLEILCMDLGLSTVPKLYEGEYDLNLLKKLWEGIDFSKEEGYTVRSYGAFMRHEFPERIFKAVRPNHVQTSDHWMAQEIIPNGLKK